MFGLNNSSGVPVMPELAEQLTENPQWFTEGGNGVPPSYPGADWFNIHQAEAFNLLGAAGIKPDVESLNQVTEAVKILAALAVDELKGRDGAMSVNYTPPVGPAISVGGYLDRQGLWVEDAIGIQQANDYIVPQAIRRNICFKPGGTFNILSGLVIDPSWVGIHGNSALLMSLLDDKVAIKVQPSNTNAGGNGYSQNTLSFENFEIIGPGSENLASIGLHFDSSLAASTAGRISLNNVAIHGFGVGEKFESRAYLIHHNNISSYGNAKCFSMPGGQTDYGENIQFFGGAAFNSGLIFEILHPSSSWSLHGMSFRAGSHFVNEI